MEGGDFGEDDRDDMEPDDYELELRLLPEYFGGERQNVEERMAWLPIIDELKSGLGHGMGGDVDVDLSLGLGSVGEPSGSTSTIEREKGVDRDALSKRPKVDSFPLSSAWDQDPTHSQITAARSQIDGDTSMSDDSEVRIDLTDDLLHMVFSFLNLIDLCRVAKVCKQWRDASSHEDFWRYLNFENRVISVRDFEAVCLRYPNATAVNVHGIPDTLNLAMKALSLLRNLQVLVLGKVVLVEDFYPALTECHTLTSLTINDATLVNGTQEIPIFHDRLHDLQIVKCRLLRISVRCPQLETLSLKRSGMSHVVLNCPLLRELDIASCHKLTDAAIRSAATSCPSLEILDMSSCFCLSNETLHDISAACVNLHFLDASYCPNISFESVQMPMLTVLKLHSCEGITSASIAAIALSLSLEVLELDNCSLLTSLSLDMQMLKSISLVHCRKLTDLRLRSNVLSSIAVSNCPLLRITITSSALKKLDLQKQENLTTLSLQCENLQEVDLTDCESLPNSICEVFSSGGGCPVLKSLALDNCESLTAVSFCSTSLVSLSLGCCRAVTYLELQCPYLEHISLDGCDHLERASFSPVNLASLNLGICPKLSVLYLEAPLMVSLELKGCGALSEAIINCPRLTSLDASFCSQLEDGCLSATATSCPLMESLVLMSCPLVGPDGLSSLCCLPNLAFLDLSYTFLVNLQPVFDSCVYLKVLKLQACKYLSDTALEPLYKNGSLPSLCQLDLSYGTLSELAIQELLAGCTNLTHVSLNGCENMHDLDWGFHRDRLSETGSSHGSTHRDQTNRMLQNLNCVGCPNIKKVAIPSAAGCLHLTSLNFSLSSNLKEVDISCPSLLVLNLSNCNSLETLKLDCPKLTSLFLQSCNLEEEAVEAAIARCNMLETLDVRFCPKMSSSSMSMLRSACPGLKRIYSSTATAV